MSRPTRHGLRRTYAWPTAAAIITLVALVSGLIGTGWIDLGAVLGLSVPTSLCVWKLFGRRA